MPELPGELWAAVLSRLAPADLLVASGTSAAWAEVAARPEVLRAVLVGDGMAVAPAAAPSLRAVGVRVRGARAERRLAGGSFSHRTLPGAVRAHLLATAGAAPRLALAHRAQEIGTGGATTLGVYDLAAGERCCWIRALPAQVLALALDAAGQRLLAGTDTGQLHLLDAGTGVPRHVFAAHGDWVRTVSFAPDGRSMASGSIDGTLSCWHAQGQGRLSAERLHPGGISALAYAAAGGQLASGGSDSVVRLWPLAGSGAPLLLRGHAAAVYAVAYPADDAVVASASRDQTVRLWHPGTGAPLRTLSHTGTAAIGCSPLAFSADGRLLATGAIDFRVRVWRTRDGAQVCTLDARGFDASLAWTADGATLACASRAGGLRLYDLLAPPAPATIQAVRQRAAAGQQPLLTPTGVISAMVLVLSALGLYACTWRWPLETAVCFKR